MHLIFKQVIAACTLALFMVAGFAPQGHAQDTRSRNHDPRCLVDLGNQDRIEIITLLKQVRAQPSDCSPACPFRNISTFFFLTKIKSEELRQACYLHVNAPQSLSPSTGGGGGAGVGGNGNIVIIFQDGNGNVFASYQNGSGNLTIALQDGSGNVINVTQNGFGNSAGIIQGGNNNNLNLNQSGNNNTFIGTQNGNDTLNLNQSGNQTTISHQ